MFRILSLACSPSGTSFVCSAAAQAAHSEGDARVSGPVSGHLLLWDTKTVKQQVLEPNDRNATTDIELSIISITMKANI